MSRPYESAQLNLQLFDLRREAVLREARAWYLADFHPETLDDAMAIIRGPRNTAFRMVVGYWDMAASLVTSGAIDAPSFLAAHGEIIGTYALVAPFVAAIREATGNHDFLSHVEKVVAGMHNSEAMLAQRRARLRGMRRPPG